MELMKHFEVLLKDLPEACQMNYGKRLISLVVFGSVGRHLPKPDSDIDLLLIVDPPPEGRLHRVEEFGNVEHRLSDALKRARNSGIHTRFSPVFKTPDEARKGSPLLLDMIEDSVVLIDREGFFQSMMTGLKERLDRLGAHRVWRGDVWYWDLKPDFKPGEVFDL